jgi:hypothetical protein
MRINTQERAISGDINRLQSFAARGFNETMRHLLLIGTSDQDLSLYAEPTSLTTPLSAEILRGMCVRPSVGSLNVLIDSGVIFVIDPSSIGPDDSICIPVKTDGVTLPGALTMTANVSGFDRVDIIECRVSAIPITATDNRDIFDPTTGLFTATTVTKEIESQLEYRVRLGTPGGGYPGASAGWLPLCVAVVPNGATDNDAITFWDVRPLAEDHDVAPFNVERRTRFESCDGMLDRSASTVWTLSGIYRGSFKGRRVGGLMRRGSPGTDADSVNLFETANKEAAYVEPVSTALNYYVYLMVPFGLPRWSRYTDASSGLRAPREPKGILILSQTPPLPDGTPSAPISLANIFGAGAASSDGVFVTYSRNNPSFTNALANTWMANQTQSLGFGAAQSTADITCTISTTSFFAAFPAGRAPQNAKAVYFKVFVTWTGLGAGAIFGGGFRVFPNLAGIQTASSTQRDGEWNGGSYQVTATAGGSVVLGSAFMRVPLPMQVGGRIDPLIINGSYSAGPVATSITASYIGFDF